MNRWFTLGLGLGFSLAFAGTATAQVKLGVAGPITGGSAAFGAQLKNGVEQAVEDINKAGGILGQKLSVTVGDDRADPKEGVSVANKLVGDAVKFVVGHFNSGVTIPASDVYKENGMLMISPSATNPQVTDRAGMDTAMAEGFQFVAMARALLREPDLPNRIRAEASTKSLCIHCNRCMPTIYSGTRCPEIPAPA